MFSKLKNVRRFSTDTIDLKELHKLVKDNPQKEMIQRMRQIGKCPEYSDIKSNIACITPHCVVKGLKNDDVMKFSGYLFYDIDGIDDENELNDTIHTLNDTFPIAFIQKSVGGKGINFLIRLTDDTIDILNDTLFINIYKFVSAKLGVLGFQVDKYAGGITRKMNISSDEGAIMTDRVMDIDLSMVDNFIQELSRQGKKKVTTEEKYNTTPNDTFKIIPHDKLDVKTEIVYGKDIDGDFVIEDMDYYRILIPKQIKDGSKHRIYTRVVNALYYINPSINRDEVFSYIYWVNKTAYPPMETHKLSMMIKFLCDEIESTGEVRIKPRIKRIHFNKNSNIDMKEKQRVGAQITAAIKTNKTRTRMIEAVQELVKKNIPPTQMLVSEMTGISIATIKRNWDRKADWLVKEPIEIGDRIDVSKQEAPSQNGGVLIDEEEFWKNSNR